MNTARLEHSSTIPSTELRLTPRGERAVRWGAGIAIGSLFLVSSYAIADKFDKDYTYSPKTIEVVADFNQGPLSIARTVKATGEPADLRDIYAHIKLINPGLSNGIQPGEHIVVPESVVVD